MSTAATEPLFTLKASKFLTNSGLPAQVAIYANRLEFRGKFKLVSIESQTIGYNQVASVSIKSNLKGTTFSVETTGGARFEVEKVNMKDAKQAELVINERRFA